MQAGSAGSQTAVLEATRQRLESGADPVKLGDDLFAVALTLDERHSLRRALTEPAVPPDAKAALVHNLLGDKVCDAATDVVETAARRRWSRGRDMADALERASVTAHVAQADDAGNLDDLEDNLFRFGRVVAAESGLRDVLSDPEASLQGKRELLHRLLEDKVEEPTEHLLGQAVAARYRSLSTVLAIYQEVAAQRRDRLVATVWAASPLSRDHKERLARALSRHYDHEVHLNTVVDPSVLGGVRVAVGDEVIDSTVESRLAKAHRRLEH